ncbi:MAG: plasmid recombination protein [Ruminococcus sp.]|nr:plasmid recombination protein [Ruminococcus sp.]
MKEKRISFGQGKGSLTHNNREFTAQNVDPFRTPDNITFVCQPIAEAYDYLFKESTERYNAKQTRNDRKISDYYEHLFGVKPCNTVRTAADKRKSFYEDVVQIGKREDSGYGTEDFQLVADCLKEYMAGFQARNTNFYVFNAVLHMDEATPHLHIDYIPVGHYKRGQDIQNGIAQALKEMGYGTGKNAIARWRTAEVEVLNKICREHGIEPLEPEKARGTLTVSEYKEQRIQADKLAVQNEQKQAEIQSLDETITERQTTANDLLNYIPDYEKDDKTEAKFQEIQDELNGYLSSKISIMTHKDKIQKCVEKLLSLVTKLINAVFKAHETIFSLREHLDKIINERDDLSDKVRERNNEISDLRQSRDKWQARSEKQADYIRLLHDTEPLTYERTLKHLERIESERNLHEQQKKKSRYYDPEVGF